MALASPFAKRRHTRSAAEEDAQVVGTGRQLLTVEPHKSRTLSPPCRPEIYAWCPAGPATAGRHAIRHRGRGAPPARADRRHAIRFLPGRRCPWDRHARRPLRARHPMWPALPTKAAVACQLVLVDPVVNAGRLVRSNRCGPAPSMTPRCDRVRCHRLGGGGQAVRGWRRPVGRGRAQQDQTRRSSVRQTTARRHRSGEVGSPESNIGQ